MHPATHRALRELAIDGRLLSHRWRRLADRLADGEAAALRAGADHAEAMVDALADLAEPREVPLRGGATALGSVLGESIATVVEPFMERNQALRAAVLDAHRTTVLLHYLEHLARAEGDDELAEAANTWAHRLVVSEGELRELAIAQGDDPDRAIEPIDDSSAGRAAHQLAVGAGALGEWMDGRRRR
jgi:hypothetical protein